MGFKVASRVRGLSDEAFREAFGAEEQCRSALSRLRWRCWGHRPGSVGLHDRATEGSLARRDGALATA